MAILPTDAIALGAVVFLLGLKHGLDPDHLAAIDGLARYNAPARPRVSRWSGLLFSLGHGVVVTFIAVAVTALAIDWQAPGWLEYAGELISIGFLVALGVINLAAILRTPLGEVVRPVGAKSRVFANLTKASHPLVIASVGAAFAVSFDTISQAALFAVTASGLGGWVLSATFGLVFTLGMVATDAVNGLWIARLIGTADSRAAVASRILGVAIALLSLGIAALGTAKLVSPAVVMRHEAFGAWTSGFVFAVIVLAFLFAVRMSARARAAA